MSGAESMENVMVPARAVLEGAASANRANGHENLGALSEEFGFLPSAAPCRNFPDSHRVWDELATRLPELHRTLKLRSVFDVMPNLATDKESLPDEYLSRASLVLSNNGLANATVNTTT